MSVLRRALGIAHDRRSVDVTILPSSGTIVPDHPAGYGIPGFGSWGAGMVWQPGAGTSTSPDQAMTLSAVFGCLRILSQAISTLPADTFIRLGGVRKPYRPRPAYLDFQPPSMGKVAYLSQIVMSLLCDGNAFVATPRDNMGSPTALIPLSPSAVSVKRDGGSIVYEVAGVPGTWTELDIMHIPIAGMVMPGALRGTSPLAAAREVVDGARKAQDFGRNFLSNHAIPPAVIKVPGSGGPPEVEREKANKLKQVWQATNGGSNAGSIGVLIGGAELQTIAISPEDAQWLDSKRFSVSEIARFFGVPPHLIADASNSTSWGSGLAEQNLAFGQFSLRPMIEAIEEAHSRLLTTDGKPDVFWKLNMDAVLRAAPKDRAETYAIDIQSGVRTVDECRALEDLGPKGQADEAMPVQVIAEAVSKLWRGVGDGLIMTSDEARELLNRDGAGLVGPAPPPKPIPAGDVPSPTSDAPMGGDQ